MEQFELRFIVCGSDLAAARTGAKALFEAPLPGKVMLRQEGKFLLGTVTIGYPGAASPDWQAVLTANLLRECVEAVLNNLGLPYCVFEGAEISPDSQLSEMAQALGAELLFQSIWQTEEIDRFCSKHVPSLVRSGCLDRVLSFAKRVLVQQVWDDAAGKTQCEAGK